MALEQTGETRLVAEVKRKRRAWQTCLEIDRDRDVAPASEEPGHVQHVAHGTRDREFIECEPRRSPDESVGSVGGEVREVGEDNHAVAGNNEQVGYRERCDVVGLLRRVGSNDRAAARIYDADRALVGPCEETTLAGRRDRITLPTVEDSDPWIAADGMDSQDRAIG